MCASRLAALQVFHEEAIIDQGRVPPCPLRLTAARSLPTTTPEARTL